MTAAFPADIVAFTLLICSARSWRFVSEIYDIVMTLDDMCNDTTYLEC